MTTFFNHSSQFQNSRAKERKGENDKNPNLSRRFRGFVCASSGAYPPQTGQAVKTVKATTSNDSFDVQASMHSNTSQGSLAMFASDHSGAQISD